MKGSLARVVRSSPQFGKFPHHNHLVLQHADALAITLTVYEALHKVAPYPWKSQDTTVDRPTRRTTDDIVSVTNADSLETCNPDLQISCAG